MTIEGKVEEAYSAVEDKIESLGIDYDIVAVMAYGSMNTGLYIEGKSDVDCYAIYVPSLKHGLLNPTKTYNFDYEYGIITMKDIRDYVEMLYKAAPNWTQTLYTEYIIYNSTYRSLFKDYLRCFCNTLGFANPKQSLHATVGLINRNLKDYEKNKNNKENDKMLKNIISILNSLTYIRAFISGVPDLVDATMANDFTKKLKKGELVFNTEYGDFVCTQVQKVIDKLKFSDYQSFYKDNTEWSKQHLEDFAYRIFLQRGMDNVYKNKI